jgi:MFS family permease
VAIPFQLYDETGSTLLVGLLGIAALVPLLVVPIYGGAVADAVDRRRMLLLSDIALLLVTVGLLVNAMLPEPHIWALYAGETLGTAAYGFQRPARNALTPRLVGEEQLLAAIAVEDVVFSLARVAGPALAGVLIAVVPAPPDADRPSLRSILEGFQYVVHRKVLLGIFIVDTNAMIFGMPRALFPAFAAQLGGGPSVLGFMYSSLFAGALLASLVSGWMGAVRRQGVVVCLAAGGWGVAIALVGFAQSIWLALVLLAVAGAADFVSAVMRSNILLSVTPDSLRGRLSGIELAQVAGAPEIGNVEAGIVASLASVRASIVSGGLLTVIGTALCAVALPVLIKYDARDPHAE